MQPSGAICPSTQVTFTAIVMNGSTAPTFQWLKNSVNTGTNAATYTSAGWSANDSVIVILTSNELCATPLQDTSNLIRISVIPRVMPAVSIVTAPGTSIASGQTVTFTAVPVNNSNPTTYQWRKNGTDIAGQTAISYVTNTLADGDVIAVRMTSAIPCYDTPDVVSAPVVMNVRSSVPGIAANAGNLSIIPNPNRGIFKVLVTDASFAPTSAGVLSIVDLYGRVVYETSFTPSGKEMSIPVTLNSAVSSGFYFLRLCIGEKIMTRPFQLQ